MSVDSRFKVSLSDAGVAAIKNATFPDYRGRKYAVEARSYPLDVSSYWSGGSRSYFVMVDLSTMRTIPIPENGSGYVRSFVPEGAKGVDIKPGYAIVEHVWFCGKDFGLRIHIHPDNLPKFLPAAT